MLRGVKMMREKRRMVVALRVMRSVSISAMGCGRPFGVFAVL